jgi:hypothetical protein
MDSALTLLLNLQKLSLSPPADQSILAIVPPEDLAAEALAGLLSEQDIQQVQDMCSQLGSGKLSAAEGFSRANTIARVIREKERNSSQKLASSTLNRLLEDILLLRFAADTQVVDFIDLRPESIEFFRYITTVQIDPAPGQPTAVIVGLLPQSIGQQGITTGLKSDSAIERRTEIVYNGASPYPRLNLNLPSRRGIFEFRNKRSDWVQRPFPEYDLEVYSFQERLLGSIQTRYPNSLDLIMGKTFSITIPKQEGIVLVETSFLDPAHRPLARYIRLAVAEKRTREVSA